MKLIILQVSQKPPERGVAKLEKERSWWSPLFDPPLHEIIIF
jgi:hypothetical protein